MKYFKNFFNPEKSQSKGMGAIPSEVLYCEFLSHSIQSALNILGSKKGASLLETKTLLEQGAKSKEEFRDISEVLYADLLYLFGSQRVSNWFESAYQKMSRKYEHEPNFPAILQLLPIDLLDEKKINFLDRDQIKMVLLDRINELKKAYKSIHSQQETMLAADRLKTLGEMAGGVAHEINNPLAIIKGKSEILTSLLESDEFDKTFAKKQVGDIVATTTRIANIVRGLRSFSRDGSHDPHYEISIKKLIEEILALCKEKFKSHGFELTVNYPKEDCSIWCNPTEISQVILNLLNNSFDACSGTINPSIRVDIETKGDIVITVSDNGPGIPKDIQEKVMRPFFTTKEIGRGTGLGLSISQGIVEKHSGKLELKSQPGATSFAITLPNKGNSEKISA